MNSKPKRNILLVEDEVIIAMTEKKQLEKYGYNVVTVLTGEKAIELLNTSPEIDVILMDINLGKGLDGTQTAEHILSVHEIPIMFLSSHTEPEVVEKTENITSYGYVVKNSSITVLDASIKMALKLFEAKKRTEESEQKYRFIASNVPDIIYSLDGNGQISSINYPSFEHYGYKVTEVTAKPFMDFVHPDDRAALMNSFMTAVKEQRKNTTGLQFRLLASNGSEIWVELNANAQFDGQGGYLGEQGVIRDITERKKNEKILEESEIRYRLISENISDGIAHFSADGAIDYVSPAYLKLLGYPKEEEIGRTTASTFSLIHEDDRDEIMAILYQAIAEKKDVLLYNFRVRTATGTYIRREDHAHFLYTDAGAYNGAYIICRDISSRDTESANR